MTDELQISKGKPPARRALDLVAIGAIVRNERRRRSLTQADLAQASGVSKSRIEAIESGRCRDAGFILVSAVLCALDLSLQVIGLTPVQID
jgi:transcriptional regulator with XRE-family HTH domain